MADIDRRNFESAEIAFEHLNADSAAFANLAKQKLIQIGTALSTLDVNTRPGGWFRPIHGSTLHNLMHELLLNGKVAKLSSKSWKCVKIKDSCDVCFYSDSYHLDLEKANKLTLACSNVGLEVRIFEFNYHPPLEFEKGYTPRKTAKVIVGGYEHLCRGKLVGFIVCSYNNPHESRTTTGLCKRKRL